MEERKGEWGGIEEEEEEGGGGGVVKTHQPSAAGSRRHWQLAADETVTPASSLLGWV